MNEFKNEANKVYGYLTVLYRDPIPCNGARWICKCICGKIINRKGHQLRKNQSTSCGCKRYKPENNKNRLPLNISATNRLYQGYQKAAQYRNYEFKLTKEEFIAFLDKECYYCGKKDSNCHKRQERLYYYNGIDRKDNKIGYLLDNCVTCCFTCNYIKNDMSHDEFLIHIKLIYERKFNE